jgi:hypothetical protein
VARHLEHREARDLVALAQRPRHRVRRPRPEAVLEAVDEPRRLRARDPARRLHRLDVARAAPQRDAALGADRV